MPHLKEPHLKMPYLKKPHAKDSSIIIQIQHFKHILDTKMHNVTDDKMQTMTYFSNYKENLRHKITVHTSTTGLKPMPKHVTIKTNIPMQQALL